MPNDGDAYSHTYIHYLTVAGFRYIRGIRLLSMYVAVFARVILIESPSLRADKETGWEEKSQSK